MSIGRSDHVLLRIGASNGFLSAPVRCLLLFCFAGGNVVGNDISQENLALP